VLSPYSRRVARDTEVEEKPNWFIQSEGRGTSLLLARTRSPLQQLKLAMPVMAKRKTTKKSKTTSTSGWKTSPRM
jgi:hypothetical protein